MERGEKQLGKDKVARIPVKVAPLEKPLPKPPWLRIKAPHSKRVQALKSKLREQKLHTVCEEATCPNLPECFGNGTATFMILGDICTRRCPFCDVAHGRPLKPDANEPKNLADTIHAMDLSYVVVTSVDRDDLKDGGAQHFVDCIAAIREQSPQTKIEVLVPDFRGRMDRALEILRRQPPDVFNHNIETVPQLYKQVRPGSNYEWSLQLIQNFKREHPSIPTKSGLMLGLGEERDQVLETLQDLRAYDCDMLTLGQYLQPTSHHLPVRRYLHPNEFEDLKREAEAMGFVHVASGPFVRSSYHADQQAKSVVDVG